MDKKEISKLERDLVKAIVKRTGISFSKAIVVSQVAAKIALELAEKGFKEGYFAGLFHNSDDSIKAFKQFIQDYE